MKLFTTRNGAIFQEYELLNYIEIILCTRFTMQGMNKYSLNVFHKRSFVASIMVIKKKSHNIALVRSLVIVSYWGSLCLK